MSSNDNEKNILSLNVTSELSEEAQERNYRMLSEAIARHWLPQLSL